MKGTYHTQVRAGYVSDADQHTEPGQLFVTLVSVCSSLLSAGPDTLTTSVATVISAEGHP